MRNAYHAYLLFIYNLIQLTITRSYNLIELGCLPFFSYDTDWGTWDVFVNVIYVDECQMTFVTECNLSFS